MNFGLSVFLYNRGLVFRICIQFELSLDEHTCQKQKEDSYDKD